MFTIALCAFFPYSIVDSLFFLSLANHLSIINEIMMLFNRIIFYLFVHKNTTHNFMWAWDEKRDPVFVKNKEKTKPDFKVYFRFSKYVLRIDSLLNRVFTSKFKYKKKYSVNLNKCKYTKNSQKSVVIVIFWVYSCMCARAQTAPEHRWNANSIMKSNRFDMVILWMLFL